MIRQRRLTDEVKSSSFRATVPFSWEKKPGTSKHKPYSSDRYSLDYYFTTTTSSSSLKLTPPPAHFSPQLNSTSSTAGRHCQSPRSSFLCSTSFRLPGGASPAAAKSNRLQEDPFFAAYIKCTQMHNSKSGRRYAADNKHDAAAARFSACRKKHTWFFRLISSVFSSFKYSSAVRDDSSYCRNNAKSSR